MTMNKDLSVLCASHIECCQRLMYLHYMLNSWFNQTVQCKLYLSISYKSDMSREIFNLMKLWKNKTKLFNFSIRPAKCSQFEHYYLLLNENKLDWILFTDDDDLWNTNRVEKYLYCEFKDNQIYCIFNTLCSDDIYVSNVKDIRNTHMYPVCEYVNYCLQSDTCLKVFNDIVNNTNVLLKISVFDLHFINWLKLYYTINTVKSDIFLYYYRLYFKLDSKKWSDYDI